MAINIVYVHKLRENFYHDYPEYQHINDGIMHGDDVPAIVHAKFNEYKLRMKKAGVY